MPAPPDALSPASAALAGLAGRGIRLGTDTARATLAALGDPHRRLPSVLVTGTNGKGSTAAMIASIAANAGTPTGRFTSPALERPNEQVAMVRPVGGPPDDGRGADVALIGDQALATDLERTIAAAERERPGRMTAFEALTVAALLWFAEQNAGLAVLEAGLGGERDATNALDAIAAVLVSVSHDHAEHLGGDLAAIAREKSGSFRAGRPAIVGWLGDEAAAAVRCAAAERGAAIRFAAEHARGLGFEARGLAPQRVRLTTARADYDLEVPLLGAHQARNAALAVLTAEALDEQGAIHLTADSVARGISECRWPGRLEPFRLEGDTRSPGATLLVDAAHNPAGAAALAAFLGALGRPYDLIFGVFHDKDAAAMLAHLVPGAVTVLLAPTGDARSWDPAPMAARLGAAASVHASLDTAIDRALAGAGERLVVACGSLRVVAAARRIALARGYAAP